VVSFTPRPLYPQGKAPGTDWIGGWVGPEAVLDVVVKRKIPSPRRESNPKIRIVQPVAQRYTWKTIKTYRNLSGEVKSAWSYTSTRLIILHGAALN
jgi:hypothetical protein